MKKEVNRNRIFYIMGVSGCGKSTIGQKLASSLSLPFFDGDDYHPEENIAKMSEGLPLNDQDRKAWLEALNSLAHKHQQNGAVIACSALKIIYREMLNENILPPPVWVYLEGSYETILNRLQQRKSHFMPTALLKSQFDTLEAPEEAIKVPIMLTPEEIVEEILKQMK
ncbi:MAG: gluconokinase [Flavobacteriaceae bacterium]|nr:gluconokinase [Eudoraea sp.]NNK20258.1 gluconokinase [Flavobacteriaceae bacterium]